MSLRQLLPWLAEEFESVLNEKSPVSDRSQSSELLLTGVTNDEDFWLGEQGEEMSKSYRDMSMSLKTSSPKSSISELATGSRVSSELAVEVTG